jgi:hypothetical protein
LRIVPDPLVADAGLFDKSGVHRGSDWEQLQVVRPVPASGTNHTPDLTDPATRQPNAGVSGSLTAGQVDWYQLTVENPGRLTVRVAAFGVGNLNPRLTLYNSDGQALVQSDDLAPGQPAALLVQHLQPQTYTLAVSAQAGAGGYRLTSTFVQADPPLDRLAVGMGPKAVVFADVNSDGRPDLVVANYGRRDDPGNTVSVLLGNGDGSFQPQQTFTVGQGPRAVAVADVNGDSRPDLIVSNYLDNSVSVLLGNGAGSFQAAQNVPVGQGPRSVAVADVNGDGKPDLVVANSGDNTVGVLLGDGAGSFQGPQTVNLPYFGPAAAEDFGPQALTVADVNGDGQPDLILANGGTTTTATSIPATPSACCSTPRNPEPASPVSLPRRLSLSAPTLTR